MKKLLFTLISFLYAQFIVGQKTNFSVKEIDSIVKHIDSFAIGGAIKDYVLSKKGYKKKIIGSGADWYYTDTSSTKLLKVFVEMTVGSTSLEAYYFYQDSLIYLKTSNITYTGEEKKINWTGKYYFQDHLLIYKEDNIKFSFNTEIYFKNARQFFSGHPPAWRR